MARRLVCCIALAIAALHVTTAISSAVTADHSVRGIAWLNELRASNGLPGDLVERADWSQACLQHERSSTPMQHSEDPADPGYTTEGDWAARNSVLAYGSRQTADAWPAGALPWDGAPGHMS